MDITKFSKYINHEIVLKINGVDGTGNIVWSGATGTWHVVWKPKSGDAKQEMQELTLTAERIEKIAVIADDLVLIEDGV